MVGSCFHFAHHEQIVSSRDDVKFTPVPAPVHGKDVKTLLSIPTSDQLFGPPCTGKSLRG
jgi:hypothetical protein